MWLVIRHVRRDKLIRLHDDAKSLGLFWKNWLVNVPWNCQIYSIMLQWIRSKIFDEKPIANEFNKFFTNVGPKMASKTPEWCFN